jgi:putative ABC transport system permease protein
MFAAALTLGSTFIVGAGSASRTLRLVGHAASNPRRHRLNALVAVELGLTLVLLVGAGLLLRSFVAVVTVDQGFDAGSAVALQVNLPSSRYPTAAARLAFNERILDSIRHAPGISSVGLTTTMPTRQATGRFGFSSSPEILSLHPSKMPVVDVHMVTAGFVEAMGLRVRQGRSLEAGDGAGAVPVVMLSEQFAKQQFPDRPAVGELVYSHTGHRLVVGVVGEVLTAELGAPPKPDAYIPLSQSPDVLQWFGTITVVARGPDPESIAQALRPLILSLDPQSPPFNIRPLEKDVSDVVAGPRFSAAVLSMFATVAFVMACLGVYGVMAYTTRLRAREIGVRMAVGATKTQILSLILGNGAAVVAVGVGLGLIAAALLARTLTGLLHEVTPADPLTLASVAAALSAAGLVATFIPARRATKTNVLTVLRED